MTGWIKIHRQITDNPLWGDKPFADGQAWIDLLLAVTYDRSSIKVKNGQRIELRRGECGYSNQTLANRWGWSRGKVTRFLSHLENEKMIQQKKVSGFNVIKVLNFDNFQNDTTNSTTNGTTNGHQTVQQTDTIKKEKKEKNDKNKKEKEIKKEKEKGLDNQTKVYPLFVDEHLFPPVAEISEGFSKNMVDGYYKSSFNLLVKTIDKVYGHPFNLLAASNEDVLKAILDDKKFKSCVEDVLVFFRHYYTWDNGFKPYLDWLFKDSNNWYRVKEACRIKKFGGG